MFSNSIIYCVCVGFLFNDAKLNDNKAFKIRVVFISSIITIGSIPPCIQSHRPPREVEGYITQQVADLVANVVDEVLARIATPM